MLRHLPLHCLAVVLLLSGCSAAPPPVATPTPGPPIDLAGQAWQVDGGGDFVRGSAVLCPSDTTIYIEDAEALATSADLIPSMTIVDGLVHYAGGWSVATQPTGVAGGQGGYRLEPGPDGAPARLVGEGSVDWFDAGADRVEVRPDAFEFAFTAIPTPDYCVG